MRTISENMTIEECMALGKEPLYKYLTRWQTLKLQGRITAEYEKKVEDSLKRIKDLLNV